MLGITKSGQLRTLASSFVFRRLLHSCQTNNCKSEDPPLGSRTAVWLDRPDPPKQKPSSSRLYIGRKIGHISPEVRLRAMMEENENDQLSTTEPLDNPLENKDSSVDNPPAIKDASLNEHPAHEDSSPGTPPIKHWSASRRRSLSPLSRLSDMVAGNEKEE